ncbi:MAG: hypothetical protein ACO2PP_06105 [Thermocrinis sp.]
MGVKTGDRLWIKREPVSTVVGEKALGQILDPFGRRISDGRLIHGEKRPIGLKDINPLQRERIREVFDTGMRTINALFTLGRGQKVGIFAGAGVGKTTLLGMITRFSKADVVVLRLIGERGREVREFVEDILGNSIERSVVITTDSFKSAHEGCPLLKRTLECLRIGRRFGESWLIHQRNKPRGG